MSQAFIFPGQGSQSVGMLKDLAENFSEVSKTYKFKRIVKSLLVDYIFFSNNLKFF